MNSYHMFIKVVELESFSAAAKVLNRTPSAVSKQIILLEESLGVQLFIRTTRALSITKAGELYYEKCLNISQQMANAETELKDFSNEPVGQLNVTWPNVLSNSDVVRSLGGFCREYPNLRLNVTVTNECLDLPREKIDFAIRVSRDPHLKAENFMTLMLSHIQPIVCATPELVERYGMPKSMEEIIALPQVIPMYAPLAKELKNFLPEFKGFNEYDHHKASDINALYDLVKLGLGAGFISRHLVEKEISEGSLIDLTGERLPKRPIYLVFPRLGYTPKINSCFINHFKKMYPDS